MELEQYKNAYTQQQLLLQNINVYQTLLNGFCDIMLNNPTVFPRLDAIIKENNKLKEENEQLKTQINELQKENETKQK